MNSEEKKALQNVMRMRGDGLIEESIQLFNQLLKDHSSDGHVLVEAIKLSLLAQESEQAYRFYMALKQLPDADRFWEVEYLIRLKICMSKQEMPEIETVSIETNSKWVSMYQANGNDPVYPVTIKDCSITCNRGPITYNFMGYCPSCESDYQFSVHMNLLIEREFLCPVCLARQFVDYESVIRPFLEGKFIHSEVPVSEIYRLDQLTNEIRINLTSNEMDGTDYPLFLRYLNMDYFYMLNQFIIKFLYPQQEG